MNGVCRVSEDREEEPKERPRAPSDLPGLRPVFVNDWKGPKKVFTVSYHFQLIILCFIDTHKVLISFKLYYFTYEGISESNFLFAVN